MGLPPRLYRRELAKREQRRAAKLAAAAPPPPAPLSADQLALADAIAAFASAGGPELLRRRRALDTAARGQLARQKAIAKTVQTMLPPWPVRTITDTRVVDVVRYTRSPIGFGRRYANSQENQWAKIRDDIMNFSEESDFIEQLRELPLDERRGLIVLRVHQVAPPSIPARTRWYIEATRRLPIVRLRLARLELRNKRLLTNAVLDGRSPTPYRPAAAPTKEPEADARPIYDVPQLGERRPWEKEETYRVVYHPGEVAPWYVFEKDAFRGAYRTPESVAVSWPGRHLFDGVYAPYEPRQAR